MGDQSSVDVNDFKFHALQKIRLAESGAHSSSGKAALAVSSTYQIGVACISKNKIITFDSSAVHRLSVNRENVNTEFKDLKTKSINLDVQEIVALSMNSDGRCLAVLASTANGPFCYIYDVGAFSLNFSGTVYHIAAIRLSAETSSKALALQWNPAIADTFAASCSDNTLLVAKIDLNTPSKWTIVGDKKLGAQVLHISWSPKGKQLTVGDSLGKISQLKPELDVVRVTMPPDALKSQTAVSGICWLETTEWLVSYEVASSPDSQVFLLSLKKDQPASWKPIGELGYGVDSSTIGHCISVDTTLLLPWNVVMLSNAKSSEISVVGKMDGAWKVWNLDELHRIDLPTNSERTETFPVGMAIDLSASSEILLTPDGTQRHRASPILMLLTTDGVLTSYHIISQIASHTDCTIESSSVDLASVKVGQPPAGVKPAVESAPKTLFSSSQTPTTGILSGLLSGSVSSSATQMFSPAPITAASAVSSTKASLFASLPQSTSTPKIEQPEKPKITATQIAATPEKRTVSVSEEKKTPAHPKLEDVELNKQITRINELLGKVDLNWKRLTNDLRAIETGIQKTSTTSKRIHEVRLPETIEVVAEMNKMKDEVQIDFNFLSDELKDIFAKAAEKRLIIENFDDKSAIVKAMKQNADFDRDERMRRVVSSMDEMKAKFAETQKTLKQLRKLNASQSAPAKKLSFENENILNKQMKGLYGAVERVRWKVDTLDDDLRKVHIMAKTKQAKRKVEEATPIQEREAVVKVLKIQKLPEVREDVKLMRQRLIASLKKKKTSNPVVIESHSLPTCIASPSSTQRIDSFERWENLKDSIINVVSPKKDTSLSISVLHSTSDAATQADAPAPEKIPAPVKIVQETSTRAPLTPIIANTPKTFSTPATTITPKFDNIPPKEIPPKPVSPAVIVAPPRPPVVPQITSEKPPTKQEDDLSSLFGTATKLDTPKKDEDSTKPAIRSLFGLPTTPAPSAVTTTSAPVASTPTAVATSTAATSTATSTAVSTTEAPKSSFGGLTTPATTTTPSTEPKSIFGGAITTAPAIAPTVTQPETTTTSTTAATSITVTAPAVAPAPAVSTSEPMKSPFGGFAGLSTGTAATTSATPTNSIFGGGTTATPAAASPFGAFGQSATTTTPTTSTTTTAASTPSLFSFKPQAAQSQPAVQPATTASFSFAPKPSAGGGGGFLSAAKAAVEEGMMEDDTTNSAQAKASTFSFSGGGFSSNTAPKPNVFGGSPPAQSSIFGGAKPQQSSGFGSFGAAAAQAAASAPAPQKSVFGGGSPAFGAAPSFGGAPKFGAPSAFGGSAFGGGFGQAQQQQQKPSVFGGGGSSGQGFAAFSGGNATFGSASGGSSIFGGGGAQSGQQSSIFGGGSQQQKSSAFTTFR